MNAMRLTTYAEFDSPATYRICVRGCIPTRWYDRLESMIVTAHTSEVEPPTCIMQGELADQAALAGVLNTLYELHLPVISVERLSE
jgi:hypothetical protein